MVLAGDSRCYCTDGQLRYKDIEACTFSLNIESAHKYETCAGLKYQRANDTPFATTFRLFELLFPRVPACFPDHAARGIITTPDEH